MEMEVTSSTGKSLRPARLFGLAVMVLGVVGWWFNGREASVHGEFWIKLCVFVPAALAGGLLMALRPEWAGPWRSDSSREHKAALVAVLAVIAVGSGVEFFRLQHAASKWAPKREVIARSPKMGTPPTVPVSMVTRPPIPASTPAPIQFLGRQYQLGSFNNRQNGMWEFVTGGETVTTWTTLLTLIERPDARTREDLDRLAEGILAAYRSRGAKILLARTVQPSPATVYNYAVAAFDEPKEQRYELDFVKVQLGSEHAAVAVYGVRIADDQDYRSKARQFLDANSSEIGRALEGLALPNLAALPRREF